MAEGTVFDKYATQYDSARRKLIPCFDEFYQTAVDLIPFPEQQAIAVLDLGAGTGLMSGLVAGRYPNSTITLVDVAEKMLEEAKLKFAHLGNRFDFRVGDYSTMSDYGKSFDLVISSLSIHHLAAETKQALFRLIHSYLKPGGLFINADQVLGASGAIEQLYRRKWVEQVKQNGTTETELEAAFERMKEDKMSTLADQLQWLNDAGFTDVNCWFKHYSFVVFSGSKANKSK